MRNWKALIARRFTGLPTLDPATEAEIVDELAEHFEQRETSSGIPVRRRP